MVIRSRGKDSSRMGRPRTGSVVPFVDEQGRRRFKVGITLPSGKRSFKRLPPGTSEQRAKATAESWNENASTDPSLAPVQKPAEGDTPADWFEKWLAHCEAKGESAVIDKRGHVRNHILPSLSHLARMTDLSIDDAEAVRNALDAKITSPDPKTRLAWKTAANVWGTFKAACRDMSRSKKAELRIRRDNPSADVEPPEIGDDRAKTFLYPSEFLQVVSCSEVPLYWRRLYVVTVYTGCRAGELRAMLPSDVDAVHGIISVTKAVGRNGKLKSTKTGETRDIPIETELAPLLQVLLDEADNTKWLRMPPREDCAELLQKHMRKAGLAREALHLDDALHKALTFHDLRGTYATWCAVRGDDPLKIKQRCGHSTFQTTEGHIRAAEVLRAGKGFGEPFPALPPELLDGANRSAIDPHSRNYSKTLRPQRDITNGDSIPAR